MLFHEVGRLLLHWASMMPLAQNQIVVPLTGTALLAIFMALGAYWGYQQGFRNLITIAFWTIVAYLMTVQGGNFVVQIINRFWQNGPRLAAFAIGQDPNLAPALDPLIDSGFQIPLFFRFVAFIALILLGFFFAPRSSWKGPPSEPLAKPLGLFVGALVILLWTNAAVVFWQQFRDGGGVLGGPIAEILNVLPNVSVLMPSLIAIFFLIIIVLIVFNFPRVWQAGGGGGGKR
ncbi:MAG: hypothetical protein AB4911_10205 [Oscillochloridaceae bacterium umkhey_bin13]